MAELGEKNFSEHKKTGGKISRPSVFESSFMIARPWSYLYIATQDISYFLGNVPQFTAAIMKGCFI